MRFMVLVKADQNSEAGVLPSEQLIVEMGKFNEQLVKAGVMLAADGLQASSKGARIKIASDGKRTVIDGPFAETKELISGFWMIQAKSKQEVIEWFLHCPVEVEIRQVFDPAEFEQMIKSDEGRVNRLREFRNRANT
jgi:hypothetical protein